MRSNASSIFSKNMALSTVKSTRASSCTGDQLIVVRKLRKQLGTTEIYRNFSFEKRPGTITAILGPNGAGKTTLFSILAGLMEPDAGKIIISRESLGYLFQNYRDSLFPWRTGYENLAFPLELRHFTKEEIRRKITSLNAHMRSPLP